MNETKTQKQNDTYALVFTIPSFLVICAYAFVFTRYGLDGIGRFLWLIVGGPLSVVFAVAAFPAIFRSRYSTTVRTLLSLSLVAGGILGLLPVWGILALFLFLRGPINLG